MVAGNREGFRDRRAESARTVLFQGHHATGFAGRGQQSIHIERLHCGHVIDFVDLYISTWHWPVFNIADVAVSLGAFLIIWKWMIVKK